MAAVKSNQPGNRPRLQVPITYVDDNVMLTARDAWTWSRLPDYSTGLPTPDSIRDYVLRNSAGLAKLVSGREDVRGHLRIFHLPTTPDQWADQVVERGSAHTQYSALRTMMDHQVEHAVKLGLVDRTVMLGINIGRINSETLWNTGPFRWFNKGLRAVEAAAGAEGEIVSLSDLENRHSRAAGVRTSLRGSMRAEGAKAQEVLDMILNSTNPGMRPPRVHLPARRFGPGLQEILFNDAIRVSNRMISYLDIDDEPIMYAAYVPVARTEPEYDIGESEPWMYTISAVGFPVDWSIRFRLRSSHAVAADLRSKTAHAQDMFDHMREAGKKPPLDLAESVALLEQFEHEVKASRTPGLYAQYVARVCDPDPKVLAEKVAALREQANDCQMEMQWSTGDQLAYALSEVPGGPDKHRPYEQHTNLAFLFGGGPTWTHRVGDQHARGKGHVGPSLATTLSADPTLVPFDPFVALRRDKAPGFMLTGSGGSGKSFAFAWMALLMALQGVTLIFIEPKGDIVDRTGRKFRLPALIEALTGRKSHIIDVMNGPAGMLEPFRLTTDLSEGIQLAVYVLTELLGSKRSEAATAAMSKAVSEEADGDDPTLTGVLQRLKDAAAGNDAAAALYETLNLQRRMSYARLLFGTPGQQRGAQMIGQPGEAVFIVTHGLELSSDDISSDEMDATQRLSRLILTLITRRASNALLTIDEDYPKALMVEEAHMLSNTPGRTMINQCIKMLRSKNGVVGLASQELGDLVGGEGDNRVMNNVTTYFGFKTNSDPEAGRVLATLNPQLDTEDRELRQLITSQQTGECWMRDVDNRVEQIATDYYLRSAQLAFETNSDARATITLQDVQDALAEEFGVTWSPPAAALDKAENLAAQVHDKDLVAAQQGSQ